MKLKSKKDNAELVGIDNAKEFSIDTDNTMIVSILRDKLYKNKVAAVCREVASNARDANREAGREDRPIEISIHGDEQDLLGDGATLLSIKDNGIGISPDRMENIFLKYGGSTKRDTNGQTGGFGIGAKTPFAYTNNFIIKTVCEVKGKIVEYLYQAVIIADGVKERTQLILINSEEVNKGTRTGTTITVPIASEEDGQKFDINNRIREFEYECVYATLFWEVKPIFLGFKNYDEVSMEVLIDNKGWSVVRDEYGFLPNLSVVASVDGIPYPIDISEINELALREKLEPIYNSWGDESYKRVIIKINTGEITLSASREDVEYIPENIDVFVEKYEKFKNAILQKAKGLIKKEKTTLAKTTFVNVLTGNIHLRDVKSSVSDSKFKNLLELKNSLGTLYSELYKDVDFPYRINSLLETHYSVTFSDLNHNENINQTNNYVNLFKLKDVKIIYKDCNYSSLRNETLIEQGHEFALFISPKKIGREYVVTEKGKELLSKFKEYLAEDNIEMINYEDVEKKKVDRKTKDKNKEVVAVPLRKFPGYTYKSSWDASSIEVDKKTKEITSHPWHEGHLEEGEYAVKDSKVIIMYLGSITDLNRHKYNELTVFGGEKMLPQYFQGLSVNKIWHEAFKALLSIGYRVYATTHNKHKYFENKKYKTIKDIKKILNKEWLPEQEENVKQWLDWDTVQKIDVIEHINSEYIEYPQFLELAGISVSEIEESKKIASIRLNKEVRDFLQTFRESNMKNMAKKLGLKAKDYGLKVNYEDVENAIDKIKNNYPAISILFSTMNDRWSGIVGRHGGKSYIWENTLLPMIKDALSEQRKKS